MCSGYWKPIRHNFQISSNEKNTLFHHQVCYLDEHLSVGKYETSQRTCLLKPLQEMAEHTGGLLAEEQFNLRPKEEI